MALLISDEVAERVARLEIPFNRYGIDQYGLSTKALARGFSALSLAYHHYFTVRSHGLNNVPPRGRAMLVGNHSGGVGFDGVMVIGSMFFEMEPPRLSQGMAEKFLAAMPFAGTISAQTGHLTGLPEHAVRLLNDERLLMVFPEGARGTKKLYKERHSLVRFGTGFIRLALQTGTPIIPMGIVGAGDAMPTIANATRLGKLLGAPYLPITPYLLPLPLPATFDIHYGEAMTFDGSGNEDDEVVSGWVHEVKDRIAMLMEHGIKRRAGGEAQ